MVVDFGDIPNDYNFVLDGLMTPDLQPSPSYFDIQRQQEPITIDFSSYEVGKIFLRNRNQFKDLLGMKCCFEMKRDQEVLISKIVTVHLPHEKDVEVILPSELTHAEKGNLLKVQIFDDQKTLHGKLASIVAAMPIEGDSLPEQEPDSLLFKEIQDDAKMLLLRNGDKLFESR